MFKKILLATHGTPGAQKAEDLALSWAEKSKAQLYVLSIINSDWQFMTGDDWLNTSATRNRFAQYVENEINSEIDKLWDRLKQKFNHLPTEYIRKAGKLEEVLAQVAEDINADVAIIGAYQKKQAPGFKARLTNKDLHPIMPCPLVIAV